MNEAVEGNRIPLNPVIHGKEGCKDHRSRNPYAGLIERPDTARVEAALRKGNRLAVGA